MIKVNQEGSKFYVSFNGKKSEFTSYINKIMSVEDKDYDFEKKQWVFSKDSIEEVYNLFEKKKKATPPPIIKNSKPTLVEQDLGTIGQSMKLQPYPYQKEAIQYVIDNEESLLVLPCGAGKTAIMIGAYLELKERGLIEGPGLIVVKASLKYQWNKEVAKFSHLTSRVILTQRESANSTLSAMKRRQKKLEKELGSKGSPYIIRQMQKEISDMKLKAIGEFEDQFKGVDLFILNYETLREADVRSMLRKAGVQAVFGDEIHMIKSRDSKRSKALAEFGDIKYKVGATATPVGKNPEDLFGIFRFISPQIFPKWSNFAALYIKYAGFGKVVGFRNLEKLREKIAPKTFVKSKEDISGQLPSLVVMQRYCELEPAQRSMNTTIMEKMDELKEQEKAIRAKFQSEKDAFGNPELAKVEAMILAHQTFAQQLANSEELFDLSESEMAGQFKTGSSSQKLDRLKELVEEILNSGEKVAIYSRFKRMQDVITNHFNKDFPDAKIAYINGSVSAEERYEEAYTKFRDTDEYKILLSTYSGAEGLNLSQCKYLILYEPAESYQIQTQIFGRLERADSIHDTVFVYELICNDSWDEIQKKIVNKKEGYDIELIRKVEE